MTATIAPPELQAPPKTESQYACVALDGVSWETYEQLRGDLDGAGGHVKIVYDDGRMTIMAPLWIHDRDKTLVGRMIEMTSFLLDVPIASCGSATWKRKDLRKALEGDEAYYVQHAAQMVGRMELDIRRDPPPDLVLEVEVTLSPVEKLPVYGALGVPEIWHVKDRGVRCLHLDRAGQYVEAEASLAFPFLRPAELDRFLAMLPKTSEHEMMRAFAEWVRTLRPAK